MEPLVLSILGLASWLKIILTAVIVVGLLLIANIVALILTRRTPKTRPPAEKHRGENGPRMETVVPQDAPVPGRGPRRGRMRRLLAGLGLLLALGLTTAALADLFFFESLTRQALRRLTDPADIRLDFSSARGSFWTGKFHFTNLTAKRPDHPISVFDLRAASAELDVSMLDLLRRRISFENLELRGVDGSWEQRARAEKEAGWLSKRLGPRSDQVRRRPFQIDNFQLLDGRLDYKNLTRPEPLATELRLDYLQAASLHSDRLLFDLLFTGGAQGAFSGLGFTIDPPAGADGRQSTWRCDGLPLPVLASLVGGPLEWFERGRADIVVENREAPGAPGGTVTNWNLVLRDFRVEAPTETSRLTRMAAAPVAAYLNSKSERLDLDLDFELRPEELRFASSSDLAELIKAALARTMSQKFETLKSTVVEGTVNRAKRWVFDRPEADMEGKADQIEEPAATTGPNL